MAASNLCTVSALLALFEQLLLVSAKQLWGRHDSLPDACSTIQFALSYCSSVSPGFDNFSPSSQAPCLCYSSTSWDPEGFDGAIATCADFFSTADPKALPTIEVFEGFCSSIGPVLGAAATSGVAATTSAAPTPAPTPSKHIASATFATPTFNLGTASLTNSPEATLLPEACTLIVSAISYCNEVTPGFTTLDPTSQAPCLCYSSTSWDPQFFDNNVKTYAGYLSTADATGVSVVSRISSFCHSIGDIRTAVASSGVQSFSIIGPVNNSPTSQGPVSTTVTPANKPTPSPVTSQVAGAARSNRVSNLVCSQLLLNTDQMSQVDWTLLGLLGSLFFY